MAIDNDLPTDDNDDEGFDFDAEDMDIEDLIGDMNRLLDLYDTSVTPLERIIKSFGDEDGFVNDIDGALQAMKDTLGRELTLEELVALFNHNKEAERVPKRHRFVTVGSTEPVISEETKPSFPPVGAIELGSIDVTKHRESLRSGVPIEKIYKTAVANRRNGGAILIGLHMDVLAEIAQEHATIVTDRLPSLKAKDGKLHAMSLQIGNERRNGGGK